MRVSGGGDSATTSPRAATVCCSVRATRARSGSAANTSSTGRQRSLAGTNSWKVVTVLTAEGLVDAAPKAAAFAGIVAVLVVGLYVLRRVRLAAFGIPIAWGLIGVWAGERATKGDVAALAIGAAVLVGAYAAWQLRTSAATR